MYSPGNVHIFYISWIPVCLWLQFGQIPSVRARQRPEWQKEINFSVKHFFISVILFKLLRMYNIEYIVFVISFP